MIPKDGLDIRYILAALRRRFWYIVIPFFLVMMAFVILCIKAPRLYWSDSLILLQPQEVPSDYVRPTVTSDIQFRLYAITDEIKSRSNLEEIIKKFDLYPKTRLTGSLDQAVGRIRERFSVEPNRSGRRGTITSFTVGFWGKQPQKVMEVTAALTDLFIQYNFKLRQEQAADTSDFLKAELAKMKKSLRQWENKVGQFKQEHVGFLPENMENNYRILSQLQQHLDSLNTTLQKTEDRKVLVQTRSSRLENFQGSALTPGAEDTQPTTLIGLRQQLQTLQTRYSDRHPDVIRLKALIKNLEKQKEISTIRSQPKETIESSSLSESERLISTYKQDRFAELKLVNKEILSLRKQIEKTESEIEKYRRRIEKGPEIEASFVDLRRGYEQASANYTSLLQKKLQADLSQNLERTRKGEQFKIKDYAYLPQEPFKPNIKQNLAIGLMLGLVCGFGLAFLREYLDSTFWSRKEVESVLKLPVLATIPVIQTDKERLRKKLKMAGAVCILLVISSTLGYALFLLWKKSPGFLPIPL